MDRSLAHPDVVGRRLQPRCQAGDAYGLREISDGHAVRNGAGVGETGTRRRLCWSRAG